MAAGEFPADFLWGAATAAAQIEGAAREDGKGESIWDEFCRRPGAIADASTIEVACDHYHRMPGDVGLMRDLGLKAYRFSVSWPRVVGPDGAPNQRGLDFYRRLVDALRDAGIEPWLTLYHWDLPTALQRRGGWASRESVRWFERYARIVYAALGDRVRIWTTLNEPWCTAFHGYGSGEHAPGIRDRNLVAGVVHHQLLGHGRAVRALREQAASRRRPIALGITLNMAPMHPARPDSPADRAAAAEADGIQNRIFADPLFLGAYPGDIVAGTAQVGDLRPWIREGDMDTIREPLDVLGINFYDGATVTAAGEAGGPPRAVPTGRPTTGMGWEITPEDLGLLLRRTWRDWAARAHTPLVVTENGAAFADEPDARGYVDDSSTRIPYLRDHIDAVREARRDGVDVRGYFVWSLLDNFEWAHGYTKRFGLVRVDYPTQRRIPKASAAWYARLIASNGREMG